MGFLDNIFNNNDDNKDKDKKKNSGGGMPNIFANLGGQPRTFHGQGQSLGGREQGTVLSISLPNPGPLGIRIEKRPKGSAIINEVIAESQAEQAGLKRGDILCFAGSNGQEEITYEMFLELARSEQRPIALDIRRLDAKIPGTAAAAGSASSKNKSAEAELRRQAVIAAAEARDKAHKAKQKPMKQVTKTTLERERLRKLDATPTSDHINDAAPKSEDAKKAAEAAKQDEARLAVQLGYNPYETARSTAGQARNAVITVEHGAIASTSAGNHLPVVAPPAEAMTAAAATNNDDDDGLDELPPQIEDAFTTLVTANANQDTVKSTCTIIKKLVVNATTKGQKPGDDAAKFRKVRLGNPKIQAAIVEVDGAVEFLMATGFSLEEQNGESHLIYPADCPGPDWLPAALKHLERQS